MQPQELIDSAVVDPDGNKLGKVGNVYLADAPRIDADGHLSPEESEQLYHHYGLPIPHTSPDGRLGRGQVAMSGRSEVDAQAGMIRSEDRLNVRAEQVETGRVRLRKYVVTEEQQVTVPVRHEDVRVEREPITRGERGAEGEAGKLRKEQFEVTDDEGKRRR